MIRALMMAAVLGLSFNAMANDPAPAAPAEQPKMEAGKDTAAAPAMAPADAKAKKGKKKKH